MRGRFAGTGYSDVHFVARTAVGSAARKTCITCLPPIPVRNSRKTSAGGCGKARQSPMFPCKWLFTWVSQQVILIGVDHSFATKGKPNTTVVSEGDDPNHFSGNYFGKGFRWQLPDLDTSELGYIRAREAYREDRTRNSGCHGRWKTDSLSQS